MMSLRMMIRLSLRIAAVVKNLTVPKCHPNASLRRKGEISIPPDPSYSVNTSPSEPG